MLGTVVTLTYSPFGSRAQSRLRGGGLQRLALLRGDQTGLQECVACVLHRPGEVGLAGEGCGGPHDVQERQPVRLGDVGYAGIDATEDDIRLGAVEVDVVRRGVVDVEG